MLTVDIVSDIVCPWCFIGTRRLAAAIELVRRDDPGFTCRTHWRPFFLNPDTPPEGEPYLPFLERKFGGRAPVEALFARVRAAGEAYGLDYTFGAIRLRANTLRAHRLIDWAQRQGSADALVERLFVAQFQRGEHVGDPGLLARIAGECGFDAAEAARYLASGQGEAEVRADERQMRALGVRMIPTFLLPGGRAVVGAEDPAVLAAALRRAA
ncbi:MAG: DsbA family oxidoreductase [Betaproteobacteria bacterium]|nr:DsbA family oxidoreductase [Betaproteobacteria bacterium]